MAMVVPINRAANAFGDPAGSPEQGGGANPFAMMALAQMHAEGRVRPVNWLGDMVGGMFKRPDPPTVTHAASENQPFPTDEDVKQARESGFAYGKEWENMFEDAAAKVLSRRVPHPPPPPAKGKRAGPPGPDTFEPESAAGLPGEEATNLDRAHVYDLNDPKTPEAVKEGMRNVVAKAALAVNRDPIASLGFEPSRAMADIVIGKANIGGVYNPDSDSIYYNMSGGVGGVPSALVHESIHRGVEMLRKRAPDETKAAMRDMDMSGNEEAVVRYIMQSKMGDPEIGAGSTSDKQRAGAVKAFEDPAYGVGRQAGLERLRALAAREIARKHPGGPR